MIDDQIIDDQSRDPGGNDPARTPRQEAAMHTLQPLALVVAVSRNGVIGRDGSLPWHIPEDLRHFRQVTVDHAVIMGRKTYASIGKPLPKRRNIVVTRNRSFEAPGCEVVHSLDEALALARETDPEPRVIGGSALFSAALPLATHMFYTRVERNVNGDVLFPAVDDAAWHTVDTQVGAGVTYLQLERVSQSASHDRRPRR